MMELLMEIYFHENFEFKELLLKAFYYGIIKRPIINYSLSNRNDSFQILCFIISHIFNSFVRKMANDQPMSISFVTDSIIRAIIGKRNQIKCIKCNYVLGKTRGDKIPRSTIRQTPTGSWGKNITFAVTKPSFPSHRRPFFSHGFVIVRKDRNTTRNLRSINYIYTTFTADLR